jgi:hypothetical protein
MGEKNQDPKEDFSDPDFVKLTQQLSIEVNN